MTLRLHFPSQLKARLRFDKKFRRRSVLEVDSIVTVVIYYKLHSCIIDAA